MCRKNCKSDDWGQSIHLGANAPLSQCIYVPEWSWNETVSKQPKQNAPAVFKFATGWF